MSSYKQEMSLPVGPKFIPVGEQQRHLSGKETIQSVPIKREHGELYIFKPYHKPFKDCLSSGI